MMYVSEFSLFSSSFMSSVLFSHWVMCCFSHLERLGLEEVKGRGSETVLRAAYINILTSLESRGVNRRVTVTVLS